MFHRFVSMHLCVFCRCWGVCGDSGWPDAAGVSVRSAERPAGERHRLRVSRSLSAGASRSTADGWSRWGRVSLWRCWEVFPTLCIGMHRNQYYWPSKIKHWDEYQTRFFAFKYLDNSFHRCINELPKLYCFDYKNTYFTLNISLLSSRHYTNKEQFNLKLIS